MTVIGKHRLRRGYAGAIGSLIIISLAIGKCRSNFKTIIFNLTIENNNSLWNCSQADATESLLREINIGTVWFRTVIAIIWANIDPDLCRHMASLVHNAINPVRIRFVQSLRPRHNPMCLWSPQYTDNNSKSLYLIIFSNNLAQQTNKATLTLRTNKCILPILLWHYFFPGL